MQYATDTMFGQQDLEECILSDIWCVGRYKRKKSYKSWLEKSLYWRLAKEEIETDWLGWFVNI